MCRYHHIIIVLSLEMKLRNKLCHTGSVEKGVYFLVYELVKEHFSDKQNNQSLSYTSCLVASSTAALLSVPLCYPFEVVRTRMRKDCGQKEYVYK